MNYFDILFHFNDCMHYDNTLCCNDNVYPVTFNNLVTLVFVYCIMHDTTVCQVISNQKFLFLYIYIYIYI